MQIIDFGKNIDDRTIVYFESNECDHPFILLLTQEEISKYHRSIDLQIDVEAL